MFCGEKGIEQMLHIDYRKKEGGYIVCYRELVGFVTKIINSKEVGNMISWCF